MRKIVKYETVEIDILLADGKKPTVTLTIDPYTKLPVGFNLWKVEYSAGEGKSPFR